MKKGWIFLVFFILLSYNAVSHESERLHAEEGEGCTIDECPDIVDERGFFEVISQLPTFSLKADYLSVHYILPNFLWIILVFFIVGIISSFFYIKKAKKNKTKKLATLWILLGIILLLFYSVSYYYSVGAESGIIVCNKEECSIAMHIHADIDTEICGEKIKFPLEKGDLSKLHTHKERNLIHWHDTTPIDIETKERLRPEDLSIRSFFEQMEFNLPENCNGRKSELKVLVNEREENLDYSYEDNDYIIVKLEEVK